ncbi:MAG: M23 family metallopeptidase [Actinobacteria bacterium]|nr:M23 family metallopeptidase [Actinomycetota bacterium]
MGLLRLLAPLAAAAVVAVTPAVPVAGQAARGAAGSPQVRRTGVVLPVDGLVSRPFDAPRHPYGPGHRGVDLTAPPGTPVRSAAGGVVTFSGQVAGTRWVTVAHGGGLDTTYGRLAPEVAAGQRVRAGQRLGRLAPGSGHLDWGARLDGRYIDPLGLLGRWRVHLAPVA